MKRITSQTVKEEYFTKTLDNGLKVYLIPKPKFHRTYALFATRFGSIDIEFIPDGFSEYLKVPEGIAHFLEHKTFETKDGIDATDLFAKYGADSNAYATYDKVVFLFSCTSHIKENLNILLDFVQNPHFTKESVLKEQGIIEQELKMYLDKPYTALYNKLLENMYKKNYVRTDIGGTLSSIKEIDHTILKLCHDTFFHPSNMSVVVIGNFDLDETMNLIIDNQKSKNYNSLPSIKRRYYLEDNIVVEGDTLSYMDINKPKVGCGIKFDIRGKSNKEIYKNMICLDILSDIFFDESSDFYNNLLNEGIIDPSFSYEAYYEPTFAHLLFMVNTDRVDEFKTLLKNELISIKNARIEKAVFNRYKKVELANSIAKFNSLEYIANLMVDLDNIGVELFDTLDIKNNITLDDLKKLQNEFDYKAITFHTIYPRNINEK